MSTGDQAAAADPTLFDTDPLQPGEIRLHLWMLYTSQAPILAQLISCAFTNHSSGHDCCCQWHWWHQHWHCRQKLTSSSVPI